jgi:hypothetical protein
MLATRFIFCYGVLFYFIVFLIVFDGERAQEEN